MTLVKQESARTNSKGEYYLNFYMCWYDCKGHFHYVRVRPSFQHDYSYLFNNSVLVPRGELFEKYMTD